MSLERVSLWVIFTCTLLITSCGGTAMKSKSASSPRSMNTNRQVDAYSPELREQMPERIYEKEGWKLIVYVTNKGSRSQGIHGDLYHDGKKIEGNRGQAIKTPLGEIYYHGSEMERAHLWDTTGWTISGKSGFFNLPASDTIEGKKESQPLEYGIG